MTSLVAGSGLVGNHPGAARAPHMYGAAYVSWDTPRAWTSKIKKLAANYCKGLTTAILLLKTNK